VQAIEGEREGAATVKVVAESDDDAEFFKFLGNKGPIADAAAGGSDVEAEKKDVGGVLLRLSDASGKLEFTEVTKGLKINRSHLDSNDVFILYTGAEVFAWVGKKASTVEKKTALQFAQEYVQKAGLPPYISVARILEGGENEIFESFFIN
jgi:gelsolin